MVLLVGGVQAPGPPIGGQNAHHLLELALHLRRHVGTRLAEVLEIGSREDEHLTATIVSKIVVTLLVFRRAGPVQEVLLFTLWLLGEEVVGEADGELPSLASFWTTA